MITRMSPDRAGCLIPSSTGQYGIANMVALAEEHGYDDSVVIAAANAHIIGCATEEQLAILLDFAANDVEIWLNEHVAPEGYQFGWIDGDFFLQEDFWWCDDLDDLLYEEYELETNGIDDFEFYYHDVYDMEYDVP